MHGQYSGDELGASVGSELGLLLEKRLDHTEMHRSAKDQHWCALGEALGPAGRTPGLHWATHRVHWQARYITRDALGRPLG
jgi:hypothetical protein